MCPNCRALAGAQVPGDRRLPTDLREIPEQRRARDAHLRHYRAASAEADVVPDLHKVIEARPGPDHRVPRRAADGDKLAGAVREAAGDERHPAGEAPHSGDAVTTSDSLKPRGDKLTGATRSATGGNKSNR